MKVMVLNQCSSNHLFLHNMVAFLRPLFNRDGKVRMLLLRDLHLVKGTLKVGKTNPSKLRSLFMVNYRLPSKFSTPILNNRVRLFLKVNPCHPFSKGKV